MTLKKKGYRRRIIDREIKNQINIFGAVCIEGPKWCGKTWTSLNHAKSVIYIGDPTNNFQNRTLARLNPLEVLRGNSPRLIDEWQEVPELWDAIRFEVDKHVDKGQFILTGSSTPQRKGVLHSGLGRISRIKMRTMSLYESGDSSGTVSLESIFDQSIEAHELVSVSLDKLIHLVIRGGWPESIGLDTADALRTSEAYLKTLIEEDLPRMDGILRDVKNLRLLMRSLARNESTVVSNSTIRKDIKEYDRDDVSLRSITEYLNSLERLFVLENQLSYRPNLRSRVRVGKNPKRHFIDPSLSVVALGATHDSLKNDLNTFGLFFEALCVRDLRIYAESFGGKIFHYRDERGREIDAVIELSDGRWGAFEIKLGSYQIDEAARKLIALKEWMHKDEFGKEPSVLAVICGISGISYTREDGVHVIPITALKP